MLTSNLELSSISLVVATFLTGLLAGTFFTWMNAVTPGLGRLPDMAYLQAFQSMNRTILNPLFYIVFLGPVLFSLIAAFQHRGNAPLLFKLLLIAAILYFVGVLLVTILGNIPLNELLDKTPLSEINLVEAKSLRHTFEGSWNQLHLFRTVFSTISFILMLFACLLKQ